MRGCSRATEPAADRSRSSSASHTSLQLGSLLPLINKSCRMRGAHIVPTAVRRAFSITHYYHIHIHFHWRASFPSAQIKPKRMQKGREGGDGTMEREKEGELMMKCRPRPQLIAFQFACKWFSVRAGPISWGVNRGGGWETTLICCPGTRHESPRCQQDSYTNLNKNIISCIYRLTHKNTHVCGLFYSHLWQHTYQRVNFHRKLVLLVLHRWALMTWQEEDRLD